VHWKAGVPLPAGAGIFLFCSASRSALGPTQSPIQRITGPVSPGETHPEREADHSPPSSAEIKNGGAIPPLPIRLHGLVLN
jgi:hypothetical protein